MKARDILIAVWLKNDKDWDKTYYSIRTKEEIDVEKYLKGVDTSRFLTIIDDDYPVELKRSFRPPFVLDRR